VLLLLGDLHLQPNTTQGRQPEQQALAQTAQKKNTAKIRIAAEKEILFLFFLLNSN